MTPAQKKAEAAAEAKRNREQKAQFCNLKLEDVLRVGENDCGYEFAVGRIGDRWAGFAIGALDNGDKMAVLFPQIAVAGLMGVESREEAIRMTSAIARDPESGYGGIDRWFCDLELMASPDDYRCEHCGQVGCDGLECLE